MAAQNTTLILLILAVMAPRAALAADADDDSRRALPCRPTIACTADIVPPGVFEFEAGVIYRRIDGHGRQWAFPLLLKETVTDDLQLQLGTNGYSILKGDVPAQYLDDVTFGPKLRFFRQTEYLPALAVSADASIPTFRRRGYLRTYDALFTAYASKDVGIVHADLNVGLNLWRVEHAPRPQEFAALALSMPVTGPLGVMAEGYVFSNAAPIAYRDGGLLVALSETPKPWLMLDEGADAGLFPTQRSYSVFAGLTMIPAALGDH